jgi:nanoRNase/pAp phosphatase (c-di-AMP/oligoRNAs hydrolase)
MWSRRVGGVVGNELANLYPDRAHAIVTENKKSVDVEELIVGEVSYQVSIRAAINNLVGADEIAMKFGGGGRKGAAGTTLLHQINLPA